MNQTIIELLAPFEEWQTLIGSTIGVVLATIAAFVGYFLKKAYDKNENQKKCYKMLEIYLSQTSSHMLVVADQLEDFTSRLNQLIPKIDAALEANQFSFHDTNKPPIIAIQVNLHLLAEDIKSNYLQNRILKIDYLVRQANATTSLINEQLEKLTQTNKMCIEKMSPKQQNETYKKNIQGLILMTDKFRHALERGQLKTILQAKAFNYKLIKNWLFYWWKFEGISFKYFKNYSEIEDYKSIPNLVERIEKNLEKDVQDMFETIRRLKANSTNAAQPPSPSEQ